jgi:hypothetical protein
MSSNLELYVGHSSIVIGTLLMVDILGGLSGFSEIPSNDSLGFELSGSDVELMAAYYAVFGGLYMTRLRGA